jgi:hypothetical protein
MTQAKGAIILLRQLGKLFADWIWPWIVKNLWPIIKVELLAAFEKVVSAVIDGINEWFDRHRQAQEEAARAKAEEAAQNAERAGSEAEAEKYRAIAQVWREVAEQFRQEKDAIKAKLDEALRKAASDFQGEMDAMDIAGLVKAGEGASVMIKDSGALLQLPEPEVRSGSGKYRGSKEYLLVYGELIQAARHQGVITYQAVAQLMHLPLSGNHMSREVGQMLGEIAEEEISHGRPMLSALAVGVSGLPGDGFYNWAKDLGKSVEDSEDGHRRFWEAEKAAIYRTWKKEFKA